MKLKDCKNCADVSGWLVSEYGFRRQAIDDALVRVAEVARNEALEEAAQLNDADALNLVKGGMSYAIHARGMGRRIRALKV